MRTEEGRRRRGVRVCANLTAAAAVTVLCACGASERIEMGATEPPSPLTPARIEHLEPDPELGTDEEWVRRTDERELRGVSASRSTDGSWVVFVSVAEFVRDEPLESLMRTSVARGLEGVPGVDEVYEEDREVWVVTGDPSGEALVRVVGDAVDRLVPRVRAELEAGE